MDKQYLAFVDEIGRTIDGEYLYRLDFTEDSEIVWGDYFNIVPALIVPDLQPDANSLSLRAKFTSPIHLATAKKNPCYSMQDCIDGIISLCFSEINETTIYYKESPFHLDFAMEYEEVENILNECNMKIFDVEKVESGDESEIDNLIHKLGEDEDLDNFDSDDE